MKKQIISLLLILSFSVQSTYPLLDSVRKKIAGSVGVKKAKELLNMKANIRCLAKGDNCSKEKRAMLGTISALMAALVAAGITAAVSVVGGKKEPTADIFELISKMSSWQRFEDIKAMAKQDKISLKNVSKDGYSLIGAIVQSPVAMSKVGMRYESDFKKVIQELQQSGVELTRADKDKINELYNYMDGWLFEAFNMPRPKLQRQAD